MISTSSFDENYANNQPYNHGWNTISPHEYHAHPSSTERTPGVVTADFPPHQNVRMTFNNKITYEDDEAPHVMNRQRQNHHHAPQAHKKVHFVEQEKFLDQKNGKFVVHEESIDAEADGFIMQKHKKFELAKWETFK